MAEVVVSLERVLEALDLPEEWRAFVDKETGEVIMLPGEAMSAAEER